MLYHMSPSNYHFHLGLLTDNNNLEQEKTNCNAYFLVYPVCVCKPVFQYVCIENAGTTVVSFKLHASNPVTKQSAQYFNGTNHTLAKMLR